MNIVIKHKDWGSAREPCHADFFYEDFMKVSFGLEYISFTRYEVIDKPLFMLAVIKYGIVFEEV
jgi:hypothetical protein